MTEFYDIYNINKEKTGKIGERNTYKPAKGEYRIVADMFIFNSKNEMLLTKRAPEKKAGLLWEGTGGSVITGETSLECILREVKEEIGLDVTKKEAIFFKEIRKDDVDFPRFKDFYILKKDINIEDLKLAPDEVIDAKWVTLDEFLSMEKNNELVPVIDFTKEDFELALKVKQRQSYSYIGKMVNVRIDRKINTPHPKHGFMYELNYGYIPNTLSGDGEELDAYILGIDEPIDGFIGRCIAVINRLDDDDDKLIVVPDGMDFTDEEIIDKTYFQERFFKSQIIR